MENQFYHDLNQGHGIYNSIQAQTLMVQRQCFQAKEIYPLIKDYPSIAGDIFIKTFLFPALKEIWSALFEKCKINSKFSWNTNNLRWQSINQPTASMPFYILGFYGAG